MTEEIIKLTQAFSEFEDELELLLAKHFPDEPVPGKALALAVALGDYIGARSAVEISFAVGLLAERMREAARVQRKLCEEVVQQMTSPTETRQ